MGGGSLFRCDIVFKPLDMAVDADEKFLTGRFAPPVRLSACGRQIVFPEEPADQLLPVIRDT